MKAKLAKVLSLVLVCALLIGTCNVKTQAAVSEGWTSNNHRLYSTVKVTVNDSWGPVAGQDVEIILGWKNPLYSVSCFLTTNSDGVVVLHVDSNYEYVKGIKVTAKGDGCHASENRNNIWAGLFDNYHGYLYAKDYSTTITLKDSHKNLVDVAGVEPTCTTPGYEAGKKCTKCGRIIEGCKEIPATGHKFENSVLSGILEDENGLYVERKCDKCDYTERFDVTYTETAATCTVDGNFKYTAVIDEQTKVISEGAIAATGHKFNAWSEIKEKVENEETKYYQDCKCDKCDATDSREVFRNVVDPTCTEDGVDEFYVMVDGEKVVLKQTALNKTNHDFSNGEWSDIYEKEGKYYQSRPCIKGDATEEREVTRNYVAATCTADGIDEYYVMNGEVKEVITSTVLTKIDHKFGDWYVENEATYEAEGNERRDCEYNCGTKETRTIAQLVKEQPKDDPKDEPKDEPKYNQLPILEKKVVEEEKKEEVVEEQKEEVVEETKEEEPVVEETKEEEPVVEDTTEVIEDVEEVETAQGDAGDEEEDEEDDLDLDILTTPQGDALPQTGVASAALFIGLGAACIGFGGAIIAKAKKKED